MAGQLLAGGEGAGQAGWGGGGGGGLDDEKKSVYYPVMLVSLACKSHLEAINVSHGSTGQQKRLLTHVDGLCVSAGHRGGEHLLTVPWAGLVHFSLSSFIGF
jgi:hypothetical protein